MSYHDATDSVGGRGARWRAAAAFAQSAPAGARKGPAGLARHGPGGARRRLRPGGLGAERRPISASGARRCSEQTRAAARRAQALRLWPDADRERSICSPPSGRTRRSTSTSTAAPGASGLAKDTAYYAELFVNAGAHYVALDFNNVIETKGDLMPMAQQVRAAHRLGLQECRELRRRPEPHLRVRPFLGRASRRRHADHRLAEGFRRAGRRDQGRAAVRRACTTSSRCGCRRARAM